MSTDEIVMNSVERILNSVERAAVWENMPLDMVDEYLQMLARLEGLLAEIAYRHEFELTCD